MHSFNDFLNGFVITKNETNALFNFLITKSKFPRSMYGRSINTIFKWYEHSTACVLIGLFWNVMNTMNLNMNLASSSEWTKRVYLERMLNIGFWKSCLGIRKRQISRQAHNYTAGDSAGMIILRLFRLKGVASRKIWFRGRDELKAKSEMGV